LNNLLLISIKYKFILFSILTFVLFFIQLLICDLFPQIEQTLDDLVYIEYKRLRDTLQRAIHTAVEVRLNNWCCGIHIYFRRKK